MRRSTWFLAVWIVLGLIPVATPAHGRGEREAAPAPDRSSVTDEVEELLRDVDAEAPSENQDEVDALLEAGANDPDPDEEDDDEDDGGQSSAEPPADPKGSRSSTPPARTAAARAAPPKPPLTALLVDDSQVRGAAGSVRRGMEAVLARNTLIRYRDIDALLGVSKERDRADRGKLVQADRALAEANTAFDEMSLDVAREKVVVAAELYHESLPALLRRDGNTHALRDAYLRLAAVSFFEGDEEQAQETLRRVFVLDKEVDRSPDAFPPQMRKLVMDAGLMFQALGHATLRVTTAPPGASVFLNGKKRGVAPLEIPEVPAGLNRIHLRRSGYQDQSLEVSVEGGGQRVERAVKLEARGGSPDAKLPALATLLGQREMPPGLVDIATSLGVDVVAVVTLAERDGKTEARGYLYDARPKKLLRETRRTSIPAKRRPLGTQVANDLFTRVRLDGTDVPRPSVAALFSKAWDDTVKGFKKFRKSKAFWPVVGGVAGAVVVGVTVGVVVDSTRLSPAEQIILYGAGLSSP